MQISLPENALVPLSSPELVAVAEKAKAAHDLMRSTFDAFNRITDKIRAEIARRYNDDSFRLLSPEDRRRMSERETSGRILEARKSAVADMDAIAQKQIAPILADVSRSKGFYKSAAATISRSSLDSERRLRIANNLSQSGPTEVWHAAVMALQKADHELAAAVIQIVNGMKNEMRPFTAGEFASRFAFAPHEIAVKAINGIEQDTQAALNLWRAVQQGKTGRMGDLPNALRTNAIKESAADAIGLVDEV